MQPTWLLLLFAVVVLSVHTEEKEEEISCEVDMGSAEWHACRAPGTTLERCMPVRTN
jgi:predicted secreted protein